LNNSTSLTPVQGPLTAYSDFSITTFSLLHQLPTVGKANDNTNLCNEFLLQIWKQWEDSAMLLASKKQQYKEKTKNTKAQQDRQNTQEMTAGKNKEKWAYKKLPIKKTIQNHSVYSKC
jgi:hypothetical protein